ncbi:MAG: hypothetical protein AAF517_21795 [Planctomycetota bacterium]
MQDEIPGTPDALTSSLLSNERLAQVMAMGVPAFVRRSQRLEAARERLRELLSKERDRRLARLLPDARRLHQNLLRGDDGVSSAEDCLNALRSLEAFSLREAKPFRNASRPLASFARQAAEFNERWQKRIDTVPLDEVHEVERAYNHYYPLEKACAMRGLRFRFEPTTLTSRAQLLAEFPLLPGIASP